jgi:spermidine synthase
MGTSYRSALSWGIRTTAVELSPAVRDAFGFYHADAAEVLRNPNGRVVVDDGRRYLERSRDTYDVIVIDPPPPVEAAGSSLLYSKEFYDAAKRRLNPGGILQAWIPERTTLVFAAALRTLCDSFPYVRCFPPYDGDGMHMLASMQPIEMCTPPEMLSRMPETAKHDVAEWITVAQLAVYLEKAFALQVPGDKALAPEFQVEITDDHPFNEYYFLRKMVWH